MASILSHALLKMPSRIVCMNQASEFFIGPIGFTYWKSSSSSNLQSLIWSTLLIHLMLSYIYTFTYKKGDNWMCQELGSNLVFSMLNAYFNWHGVRSFILQKCRQKMDGRKQNHTWCPGCLHGCTESFSMINYLATDNLPYRHSAENSGVKYCRWSRKYRTCANSPSSLPSLFQSWRLFSHIYNAS